VFSEFDREIVKDRLRVFGHPRHEDWIKNKILPVRQERTRGKMKITKLKIRGLFGVKEFSSDGKNLELNGPKGAGKSSVIDAIKYALSNRSDREFILTQGEMKAKS
jgi:predicted AAA+ superfamily ATPase